MRQGYKKRCCRCREEKTADAFNFQTSSADGLAPRCRKCGLAVLYGLEPADFDELVKKQQNKCAICGALDPKFHVDHDHETGKVRGLLCDSCNRLLGHAHDRVETLTAAVRYLEVRQNVTSCVSN
jgi:hypothetical protein